jgi:hypothetical protein
MLRLVGTVDMGAVAAAVVPCGAGVTVDFVDRDGVERRGPLAALWNVGFERVRPGSGVSLGSPAAQLSRRVVVGDDRRPRGLRVLAGTRSRDAVGDPRLQIAGGVVNVLSRCPLRCALRASVRSCGGGADYRRELRLDQRLIDRLRSHPDALLHHSGL